MQLLAKLPGKRYFISIFIMGTVLFSTFCTVIYGHYREAQRINGWTVYNYELARQSRKILMNLVDMETGVRGYMLTGRISFLQPYTHSSKELLEDIATLWEYTKDDDTARDNIAIWLKRTEEYYTALNTEIDEFRSKGRKSLTQDKLNNQKKQLDDLRILLGNYIKVRLGDVQDQIQRSKEQQDIFKYTLIIGTVLAVGAMLLSTVVIITLIARAQRSSLEASQAERRFRLVMNGINDGVYDYNPRDETIYFSNSYKSMLGYSDEEFPDTLQSVKDILHPEDYDGVWEIFNRYKDRKTDNYTNIFRLKHKNGDWRWILSRGLGFWDSTGQMIRCIGTHVDITEQKNRESELAQVNSDLETFTYIASHDLRSPLVNLKGFANELRFAVNKMQPIICSIKPTLTTEEQAIITESLENDIPEALKFIEKATDRMDMLTTAVLDLSRIGKHQYTMQAVDVQAIVEKCLDVQAYEITKNNLEISSRYLPQIISDPLALEQIFSNLLDNAIKYLDPTRAGKIVISARETATDVIFSVEDNGRGIAEIDDSKIFEMFRRARNAEDVRGAGMGMSFVRATLRKLGGAIWYESAVNVGTTFYIRLPKINIKGKNL